MAQLSNLIVRGVTRILSNLYCNGTVTANAFKLNSVSEYNITINSSVWSSAYPFTAIVNVTGITSETDYLLCKNTDGITTQDAISKYEKNAGYIYSAIPGNGTVTFYAKKRPTINFSVTLKEVI